MDRDELDRHIAALDSALRGQPAWDSWIALRGELRTRRRQSERMLPSIAQAAQHAAAARESASRVIEALETVPHVPPDDLHKT